MNKDNAPIYCFLDTNMLIQFRGSQQEPLYDVKWEEMFHAKHVYIVIAPIVLQELKRLKDKKPQHREYIRNTLLPPLVDHSKQEETVGGFRQVRWSKRSPVTFLLLLYEPSIDWIKENLRPEEPDDRLLASMQVFMSQNPQERVFLLTDDGPLYRDAQIHNISR